MKSITVLVSALVAHYSTPSTQPLERIERRIGAMGTTLSISVEATDRAHALEASERATRAIEAVERRLSTWSDDSELSQLNRAAVGQRVELSAELSDDLHRALECWRATDGAFDPAVGALVDAWDLRGSGRIPSPEQLAAARIEGGMGAALDLDGRTAARRNAALRIEEGGFGKGVGLDAALAALRADHVERAQLDLGGQVAVLGGPEPFTVDVADPRDRSRAVVRWTLAAGSISTSGDSEHSLEVGGARVGHILDPRTGRPAADFGSVSVRADDATRADCFSTALFVLGPEQALVWAEKHPEIDVLVLEVVGDHLRARATPHMAAFVQTLADDVELEIVQAPAASAPQDKSQGTSEERLTRLEQENVELHRRIDLLAGDVERASLGDVVPSVSESVSGLGLAASKIYGAQDGVCIGGYGEAIYSHFDNHADDGSPSGADDQFDLARAVFYIGYKFDSTWLFNSEVEFEHATTERNGDANAEFAYLDGRFSPALNMRTGLVLVPMGLINETHEPTSFPSAFRPAVETVILPSTWSEGGVGLWGDVGPVTYRTYVINSLRASGFTDQGIEEGRQLGSEAVAENLAWVGRVDWNCAPGWRLGGSLFYGDSGQELAPDVATTIFEAHVDGEWRGWRARALYAQSDLDDVAALNGALGLVGNQSVGEQQTGAYVELGYDVMSALRPGSKQSLTPFVRWETYDTQAEVPSGFSSNPANAVDIATIGVAYKPIDGIVFKLDFQDVDNDADTGVDQFHVGLGYIF